MRAGHIWDVAAAIQAYGRFEIDDIDRDDIMERVIYSVACPCGGGFAVDLSYRDLGDNHASKMGYVLDRELQAEQAKHRTVCPIGAAS